MPKIVNTLITLPLLALSLDAASYYVDYSSGSDSNNGTATATAWKHCPGDPAASGTAAAKALAAGDIVYFKGGVSYVFTGATGIILNWSGANGTPITYDGNSAGTWGTGKAILTDNYGANSIAAFSAASSRTDIVIKYFEIANIGGSAQLPTDTGSAVAAKPGCGVSFQSSPTRVVIDNCYMHHLGYSFNQKPMDTNSINGSGVYSVGAAGLTISNCKFTNVSTAIGCYASSSASITGLIISGCEFTNSIRWCCDLAPQSTGASMDNITIAGNSFHDYYQFDQNVWTGYGEWPHTDGIFFRSDYSGCTWGSNNFFYNNLFYATQSSGGTASIYITEGPSANVYNNVFIQQGKTRAISLIGGPKSGANAQKLYILNNTFVCDYTNQIEWGDSESPVASGQGSYLIVENNIFYDMQANSGNNFVVYSVSTDPATNFTWDYNLYRSLNHSTGQPFFKWSVIGEATLAMLRTHGWELHGIAADPLFTTVDTTEVQPLANDLHLKSGSPAIGAGINLSALGLPGLSKDLSSNPRPSSGAWDLGAYNYSAGGSILAPSNATTAISVK